MAQYISADLDRRPPTPCKDAKTSGEVRGSRAAAEYRRATVARGGAAGVPRTRDSRDHARGREARRGVGGRGVSPVQVEGGAVQRGHGLRSRGSTEPAAEGAGRGRGARVAGRAGESVDGDT